MKKKNFKRDFIHALIGTIFMIVSVSVVILISYFNKNTEQEKQSGYGGGAAKQADENGINVWYNDIRYEQYFKVLAAEYKKETGIDVHVNFLQDMDYLENINKANRQDGSIDYEKPDVYLLNTEELEAAYGYGLANVNDDVILNEDNFIKKSLRDVTYKGKYTAYPLSYDTAFMLYNKNYIKEAPASFDEIMRFSNEFDFTVHQDVKQIFYYNASDTIHNYFFLGAYLNFGGIYGDDENIIDIENDRIKEAASFYSEFAKETGIDVFDREYGRIPEKFVKEELLCTVVTISEFNEIRRLSEGKELNYGICMIPNLNGEQRTKPLSITQSFVINYMSDKKDMAADFIRYAVLERTDLIVNNTGFLPAAHRKNINSFDEVIQNQYEASASLPKLIISADYYVLMGEILNQACQGKQIDDLLHEISEIYIKRTD